MFILYGGTNVHALGLLNKTNMKMNQSPQEVRGLQPGWNEIPKEFWDQNKSQPDVKKMVANGTIKILEDQVIVTVKDKKTGKPKKQKVAVGLHDNKIKLSWFAEARAIELVKGTFNRDILMRWLDEDNRPKVKKALDKQVKPLLNSESEESESEASDEMEEFE